MTPKASGCSVWLVCPVRYSWCVRVETHGFGTDAQVDGQDDGQMAGSARAVRARWSDSRSAKRVLERVSSGPSCITCDTLREWSMCRYGNYATTVVRSSIGLPEASE